MSGAGGGAGAGAGAADGAVAGSVSIAVLDANTAKFSADAKNIAVCNAVTTNPVKEVVINRAAAVRANHVFSHKLKTEGKATAQKKSGRCWMFAACNIMRLSMMEKYKLGPKFELSQPFLFFYDKLEKSNYFLEQMLDTASEDVGSRVVQHLLGDLISDGGQWDMIVNLVNKYGMVPKQVFPECNTSSGSLAFNRFLRAKLREYAETLREQAAGGAAADALQATKAKMMEEVHRILLIHFGEPPKAFEWSYYDKDGEFHLVENLTPKKFYEECVPLDVNDYVSLVNDPRNKYGQLLTVQRLGNIVEGHPTRYINCESDTLRATAIQMLKDQKPVWFGCDVGKCYSRSAAIMDTEYYDWESSFGTSLKQNKAGRLRYHQSLMTHAMVFTGFDARGDKINKWRVENSWGTDLGDGGYFIMTDAWFDQYMYQVVVDKKYLDDKLKAVLEQKPVELPPWDPMGSLAGANCECSAKASL